MPPEEVFERRLATERVTDLYNMEEIKWHQMSSVKDVKEGDMNTSYFHRVDNVRKRRNIISKLMIGSLEDNQKAITSHAMDSYTTLYESLISGDLGWKGWSSKYIFGGEGYSLEGRLREEEVFISTCLDGDKASGRMAVLHCSFKGDGAL